VEQTTVITLVLVILILLWVYRSPIAPLVPLATVGVALAVSRGLVGLMAQAGLEVSALVETFMVVIVFGAGTDYCLFVVSRYKEDLIGAAAGDGQPRRTVLIGTMAVIGAVIASSAATVIVGFASQGVAEFGMYRTTGPAMAVAVLVTLVAGLTLTPALLAILGRWAFWPWRARRPLATVPQREAA
jgi:putative drug exporter of the RND superfamily